MTLQEEITEALGKHVLHATSPVDLSDAMGDWRVECDCDYTTVAPSFSEAEQAHSAHQAAADEMDARLADGTSNGRAYNSYTVARMLRARAGEAS